MSEEVIKSDFKDLHLLMNIADTLRRLGSQNEQMISSLVNDEEMVKDAMRLYEQQGIAVSEATVYEALKLHRNKALEFTKTPASVANSSFWNWWLKSVTVLPKIRNAAIASGLVGALSLGTYSVGSNLRESMWINDVEGSHKAALLIQSKWSINNESRLNALVNGLSPLYKTNGEMLRRIEALRSALTTEIYTPPENIGKEDLSRFYLKSNSEEKKAYLSQAESREAQAVASMEKWNGEFNVLDESNKKALRHASVFTLNVPDFFKTVQETQKERFMSAVNTFSPSGMDAAANIVSSGVQVAQLLSSLAPQVSALANDTAKNTLQGFLNEGQGLLTSGSVSEAAKMAEKIDGQLKFINTSYTLRIVSRPGERTGVWRYYDGNQNARQYYILVEAVDGNGNTITMPVFDSEKQKDVKASIWGVEVSEDQFNLLANEKKNTGGIAQPIMGDKKAGELTESFQYAVMPRRITSW